MDAGDLQEGFRLGEWLIEPRHGRITGREGPRPLPPQQLRILTCLAENHGEAVERRILRQYAWPGQQATDEMLRDAIASLREVLDGSRHGSRTIVSVGHRGYALIAHFELLPARRDAARAPEPPPDAHKSIVARLQALLVESQRRNVFRVVGAYLLVMWIVLQVAETTFEPLHLPGWWMTALTILAILGLPIVTVLAWQYEITPAGIVLEGGGLASVRLPKARRAVAPVAVMGVAVMAAVTGLAWWRTLETRASGPRSPVEVSAPSIAVLPLVDGSPAGGMAYLGEGLSGELALRLAQVPGLRVDARASGMDSTGGEADIRKVGDIFGVGHVLTGSVRREGESLSVTVQLMDATDGHQVWAGSYDREWRDLLAIQDDVVRSITTALSVVLTPEAQRELATRPDVDVRAFDPYLAGLAMLQQSSDLSRFDEAARRFHEALAIDPGFARAHAGLCEVGVRRYGRSRDPADLAAAEEACNRALSLNASLVETEKALAGLYIAGRNYQQAAVVYRGLIEHNPRDADGHVGLGRALQGAGQPEEAEKSFRSAVAVEPAYWRAVSELGSYLFERGRIDEAVEAFRKVTELTPASAVAYNNLGAALQMKGDLAASAEAFRRALAIEPSRGAYSNLGSYHYYLGQFAEAATYYAKAAALASQDRTMWGNLGDAVWQIPQRRSESLGYYRRAIGLAERDRANMPDDVELLAQLGYYYGRTGAADRAREYLSQAQEKGSDAMNVQYFLALNAADRKDATGTLRALEAAIALGYPAALVSAAPEFAFLSGDPAFRRVLGAAGDGGRSAAAHR